jgi:opacity protein-like surface antigen
MKSLLTAAASLALLTSPVIAADASPDANAQGAKPSTGVDAGTSPASKNEKAQGSTGDSTGMSGSSTQMPGASDSTKPDSSLSTNGNKAKQ